MNWNPSGNGAAAESLPLYKVLRLGDLAFEGNRTKGHPYGKLVVNDIGAGIMSSRFRTLAARRKVCISFWKYLLLNDGALKPIYIKCTKRGTLMTELVVPELLESELLLPSDAEQRLIGSYFSRLDDLITLHQCKCQYHSSCGHLSWEQRKLGEVFEEYSDKGHPELPALTIIQGGGTVRRDESNRNLQFDLDSLSNYKAVDPGDFIVHLRSFEGGLEKATHQGLISPAYHTFRSEEANSDFYYLYFRSNRFINIDLKPHVYGIRDGRSIDIEGMTTVLIPWTDAEEQELIGSFFADLDNLITLHQREPRFADTG